MSAAETLRHVHILGGGVGAITAAYHLSAPGWERHFSGITVHQIGWRLGGKGASGRNVAKGARIEEHGLHIWFGFYENAFRMLAECHAELDAIDAARGPHELGLARWETHFPSVERSFHPVDRVGLMEDVARTWRPWVAAFPRRPGLPWDRDLGSESISWSPVDLVSDFLAQLVELGRTVLGSLEGGFRSERERSREASRALEAMDRVLTVIANTVRAPAVTSTLDANARAGRARRWFELVGRPLQGALATLDGVLDGIGNRLGRVFWWSEEIRRSWAILDVVLAVTRGLLADRVVDDEALDKLDDDEFRAWLVRHGATPEAVDGPFVRAVVYDLAFAYVDGSGRRPECGAGTALRGLHRTLFTYRGALMWKLNGGMGDVVFMPLYELLVKRGVEFEFFHQVTDLVVRRGRVTEIEYRQQEPKPADVMANLVCIEAPEPFGRSWCWPAHPPSALANMSAAPGADGPDARARKLESTWWRREGQPRRIVVKDDLVVLGISVGALPFVARQLIEASSQWQAMVRQVATVCTEALQLWLAPTTDELGWEPDSIVGGYGKPFDTYSDMPGPLSVEAHGTEGPRSLAYFCSAFDLQRPAEPDPDPADDDAMAEHFEQVWKLGDEKLRADVDSFVAKRLRFLWPGTTVVPRSSPRRLGIEVDRYERVNIDPTDRYVLSLPRSSRYRLPPGESGFDNLVLAGDWTECTLNAGCVEAAVISGMAAAQAVGPPRPVTIIGARERRR